MSDGANSEMASTALHAERFPGESKDYRSARDKLLRAEIDLRKRMEEVAAMRRDLPLGGVVREDYEFTEGGADLDDNQRAATREVVRAIPA